ncbi:MAG: type IV pilus biogenesis/stability protein PilW [Burkholderiales bacterium]|nr:type IV pilus biogenesis/stability protein PilW [Burkholderiales bacterium]
MNVTDVKRDHGHGRRWLLAACLALVALTGLSGCASGPSGSGEDIVTDSDEPAIRKRARTRLQLASGYFEQGQTTVALDEVKQALTIDPDFPDAYNLRGLIYLRLNDMRLADESFRRALAINPNSADVLHNYGWMLCQQGKYTESVQAFTQALANPTYGGRAKTWLAKGVCQIKAGRPLDAEQSLVKSYELDAGNPVTGYNLATVLYQRGDAARAQFYIRRINNSELANAETLWLGIKVEQRMGNRVARDQLVTQLRSRYPRSRELGSFERGAFNE